MRVRAFAFAAAGTAAAVTAVGAYRRFVRPWYEAWGTDPAEGTRLLAGDELIGAPTGGDTRGITIEAPAAAIWPWLVQMGYGRAGWYSYDPLDMRGSSAETIVPAWQSIAVGDRIPAWPGGGFEVAQVEPEHVLVLYLDDEIVARQAEEARTTAVHGVGSDDVPAGLAASAAIMRTQPRRFRVSWAFILEPIDGERTRLIERLRVEYPELTAWNRLTGPLFGTGVFLMTRRQMLGLKARAERIVREPRHEAEQAEAVEAPPTEIVETPEPTPVMA